MLVAVVLCLQQSASSKVGLLGYQGTRLGKQKIAEPSSDTHGQEQPAIVRHGNQHEEKADAYLHHVKTCLQQMQPVKQLLQQMPGLPLCVMSTKERWVRIRGQVEGKGREEREGLTCAL